MGEGCWVEAEFVEMEVHVYSDMHHAKIQAADQAAWKKFEEAGAQMEIK